MATGDLALSITATLTIGGTSYTTEQDTTIQSLNNCDRRRMTVPTSAVTIITYAASVGSGTFTDNDFLLITNKDTTNFCTIGLVSGSDTCYIKLMAGQSYMMGTRSIDTNTGGSAFSAFVSITSVTCAFDTAAGDIEYLIATN